MYTPGFLTYWIVLLCTFSMSSSSLLMYMLLYIVYIVHMYYSIPCYDGLLRIYSVGSRPALWITKKGAFDSQPQVIKFTSCLPMVGGSLQVLPLLPPLKTGRHDIAAILLKVGLSTINQIKSFIENKRYIYVHWTMICISVTNSNILTILN